MLKKILIAALLNLILTTSLLAQTVFAGDKLADIADPVQSRFGSIGAILQELIPVIVVLAGMVATLLLIWGGFKYMTAQGDQKAVASARSTITGAIIGLIIILSIGVIGVILDQVLHFNIFTGVATP